MSSLSVPGLPGSQPELARPRVVLLRLAVLETKRSGGKELSRAATVPGIDPGYGNALILTRKSF